MSIFEDLSLIVNITEEDIKNAVNSTLNIKENKKERVFANVLGATIGLNFLQTLNINASNENSLYTIQAILNDIDISDIYVKNIKIDVRICQDERHLCVPVSHFEFGLTPDVYVFFILSKDMTCASFAGTTAPNEIKRNKNIDGYYIVSRKDLYTAKSLKNVLTKVKPNKNLPENADDIEKAQSLIIPFIDDDILNSEKRFLYGQLVKSIEFRNYFKEFENFELISKNIANKENILSRTILDIFDKIAYKTEEDFVESFNYEDNSTDNNDIFNDVNFEGDDTQDDITINAENSESLSTLPDDETLANFSSYEPDNNIENNEDDNFKLEDVGFSGFEGLKSSNSISDTEPDTNIIDLDNDVNFEKFSSEDNEPIEDVKTPQEKTFEVKTTVEEMDNILAEVSKSAGESDDSTQEEVEQYEDIFEEINPEQVAKNLDGQLDDIKNSQDIEELVYDDSFEKAEKNAEYLKEMIQIEAMEELASDNDIKENNESEGMEELPSDISQEAINNVEMMEEPSSVNDANETESMEDLSLDNNVEEINSSQNFEEMQEVSEMDSVEIPTIDNNIQEDINEELPNTDSNDEVTNEDFIKLDELSGTIDNVLAPLDGNIDSLEPVDEDFNMNSNEENSNNDNELSTNTDYNMLSDNNSDSLTELDSTQNMDISGNLEEIQDESNDFNDNQLDELQPLEDLSSDNATNIEAFEEVNLETMDNSSEPLEDLSVDNNETGDFSQINDNSSFEEVNLETMDNSSLEPLEELPAENNTYAESFAQINDNNSFEEVNLDATDNSSFEAIEELPAENNTYAESFAQINENNNFEEVNLETTDNSSFETLDNSATDNFNSNTESMTDDISDNNIESTERDDDIDAFADAFGGFSDMDDDNSSSSNSIEDINLDSLDGDDEEEMDGIGNIDDIDIDNIDIDSISTDDIDLSNINIDDINIDDEDLNLNEIPDFNPSENVSDTNTQPSVGEEYQPNYNENDKQTLEKLYQESTQDKIPGNGDQMDNSLDNNNVNPNNVMNQEKPKKKSNTALLLLVFVALLGYVGYTKKDLIMEQVNNLRGGASNSVLITEEQNNMPVEGEGVNNAPPAEQPAPLEGEQPPQAEGEQPQAEQPPQPVGAMPGEAGGPQDAKSMEESLKQAQKPKSIDQIAPPTTKLAEPLTSAQITKLYWELPKDLTYNENVMKYLQVVGKTSKLAIQSDLLNVTEMPYSSKMIVTIKLSRTGEVLDAIPTVSSGSKQVDSIVLQSVKSAMKYVKAPTSEFTKESYDFSLIINF